jgi:hypothetical protein
MLFLNTNTEEDARPMTICELIAISTSSVPMGPQKPLPCEICDDEEDIDLKDGNYSEKEAKNDKDEKELLDELLGACFIEYCNVLCIEWVGGVAYRKASGHILKDVWDIQPLEWIDVTLGKGSIKCRGGYLVISSRII